MHPPAVNEQPAAAANRPAAPAGARLAIVLSHPTQYYSPWFRWLRAHTDLTFRVFYLWQFGVTSQQDPQFGTRFAWDVDLVSGYEHEFVPNTAADPGTHHFNGLRNPELLRRLTAWRPSAVLLFGYNWRSHLVALAWARTRGIPVLFRGDSHFLGRGAPRPVRRMGLRALYAQFAAFLPVGIANQQYFQQLGVPARRLFHAPHAVNAAHFDPAASSAQAAARGLRAELGLSPDRRVVLFAGKLIPAKQPRELLQAFLALQPANAALVFVGDGSEKESLQHFARDAANVCFLPFANQSEMPSRYLLADVFALPSRGHYETWGLAVNEAMHMGLPVLVSDLVGCQQDLVTDGETGWVFRATDAEQLRTKLAEALSVDLSPYRARVLDRIGRYTYEQTTHGLLAALTHIESVGST